MDCEIKTAPGRWHVQGSKRAVNVQMTLPHIILLYLPKSQENIHILGQAAPPLPGYRSGDSGFCCLSSGVSQEAKRKAHRRCVANGHQNARKAQ
jgi:hypothetical protein